jgi:hypothetical protein
MDTGVFRTRPYLAPRRALDAGSSNLVRPRCAAAMAMDNAPIARGASHTSVFIDRIIKRTAPLYCLKYWLVSEPFADSSARGAPSKITLPPLFPPSGPISRGRKRCQDGSVENPQLSLCLDPYNSV